MLKEQVKYIVFDAVVLAALGYLFYRNIPIMLALILIGTPIILNKQKKQYIKKQRLIMEEQFKDAILSLAASLRAGYSVENGFAEVYRELVNLHGEESIMARELKNIVKKLKLKVTAEDLLSDLGKRSNVEDIKSFADVFRIAKRSGGDLVSIISKTAKTIGDKFDMQREIATMLAAKRFEQRIMLAMPAAILVYISLSNPGFLDVLYEGFIGRVIMSICLIVYIAAFFIGERIVNIDI